MQGIRDRFFLSLNIMIKWFFAILLCLGLLVKTAHAQPIAKTFETFLKSPSLHSASVGFCMIDADEGKIIYQYHDSLALIPASCLKIVTTGAALGLLGEDYHFKTKLCYRGNL